jgi:hypothetical protein
MQNFPYPDGPTIEQSLEAALLGHHARPFVQTDHVHFTTPY